MVDISEFAERKKQLIVSILFLLIGITIIFGLIRFRSSVRRPFVKYINNPTQGAPIVDQKTAEEQERFALTQKDTDGDGLSDYDELYVTLTSPYLPDSDSDGISDKDEVEKGQDPNCPKGTRCAEAPAPATTEASSSTNISTLFQAQQQQEVSGQQALPPLLSGKASPAEIRAVLKQAGVAEDLLKAMDDTELLQLYQETFQELLKEQVQP